MTIRTRSPWRIEAIDEKVVHRHAAAHTRSDQMTSDLLPLIDVSSVRVLARYVVELTFADGAIRVIDLEPLLWGETFEPLKADYDLFRKIVVDPDAGTVVWPNGADLSPRTLYAESKPAVPA